MTQIIDGKSIAARFREAVTTDTATLVARGIKPGLAVILVGDNPASDIYVRNKVAACTKSGFHSLQYRLPADTSARDLKLLIGNLNGNPDVHGILLQLPLPAHLDSAAMIARIHPAKDVDGLHPYNLGMLMAGTPGVVPCTPQGAMALIRSVEDNLSGLHAVVIGRSVLFGKPMGQLLISAGCTMTQAHSKTKDLPAITRQADILISATGQAGLVKADWVKPGAIVIDVGITRNIDGTLSGDVDFKNVAPIARAITPVPGGVGPMTIACLLGNTLRAAQNTL